MARKLNRSKSFGEVCGGNGAAKYTQDGIDFDADGNEIGAKTQPDKVPEQNDVTAEEAQQAIDAAKAAKKQATKEKRAATMAAKKLKKEQATKDAEDAKKPIGTATGDATVEKASSQVDKALQE
jgi:hypothetical protein